MKKIIGEEEEARVSSNPGKDAPIIQTGRGERERETEREMVEVRWDLG